MGSFFYILLLLRLQTQKISFKIFLSIMKKKTIFKFTAVFLPVIFILIIEMLLRIAGYGEDYQLFHRVSMEDKPDYLVMNKHMARKYFKDNDLRADNQSDLFLETKTDSTFRVFVQGASTVVGFPFYKGGSFPRMLKHRLALTFPNKNIEVINTGMTAVNSYTLLDLADDIIEQKPDLVIIYAGHNEYYGALGVGSSISYGSYPAIVRSYLMLKEMRFFQLFEQAYYKIASSSAQKPSNRTTTLMEVMAKEQRIPFDSKVYLDGVEQYKNNLQKVLSKYKRHDIPVILSTLVSNERDIIPFISDTIPNIEEFNEAVNEQNPLAKKIAQNNAHAAYSLGTFYLETNGDSAKKYLHLAKELDLLRFRAPEKINESIIGLSHEYSTSLVDMKSVFETHSSNGIVGDELMTEHVHPNIKGQFLMADAFYNKIKELKLLDGWQNYIAYEDAVQDIPVSQIDSIQGIMVIEKLKQSWPYNINQIAEERDSISNKDLKNKYTEIKMAQDINMDIMKWDHAMATAYKMYEHDEEYEKGLDIAQSLIFEYPEQGAVYQMAGNMCMKKGDYKRAVFYLYRYHYFENSSKSAEELATAYIKSNQMEQAKKTLAQARNSGLEVPNLNELIEDTTQAIQPKEVRLEM